MSSSRKQASCFLINGSISALVAWICSRNVIPSKDLSEEPVFAFLSNLAPRVMKNSSRLLPQIAMNLILSNNGCHGSRASSNTRALNLIQLSSLLMNRYGSLSDRFSSVLLNSAGGKAFSGSGIALYHMKDSPSAEKRNVKSAYKVDMLTRLNTF